jgi:hypothetical protein
MAFAGRSSLPAASASPLGARSFDDGAAFGDDRSLSAAFGSDAPIGSPEAPCAGVSASEGAAPLSRAPSSAPLDLDTQIGRSLPRRRTLTDGDGCDGGEAGSGAESGGDDTPPAWWTPPPVLPFAPRPLTLDQYREQLALHLRRLALHHVAHGKRRRSFTKKARQLLECGQRVRFRRCGGCGTADGKSARILTRCDLRSCPACARRRADDFRAKLSGLWDRGEKPRKVGLYLITFTLRYDPTSPDDLSVEGLQRRKKQLLDGIRYVWRSYLKKRGRAMAFAVEVSPRGAVHAHALYHGHRPDARQLDIGYSLRTGGSHPHIDYVRKPHKAIREVAKYMVKAASPKKMRILAGGVGEFVDPELAARAEVAFSGDRLVECLGAWRGAAEETAEAEAPATPCPRCGACAWRFEVLPLGAWVAHAGDDWRPSFARAGPDGKPLASKQKDRSKD